MKPKRDWLWAGSIWLAMTVLGEVILANVEGRGIFPEAYAHEAYVSDDAFVLLMRLAVPVFAFVVALLGFSVVRFRAKDDGGDGPPMRGHRPASVAWIAITTILTVILIINPGLSGLAHMRGEPQADLTVRVEGARWYWTLTYPNGASTSKELVLPYGKRVKFEVTSKDVIHSMWIPAFRTKIDAVPGRTTVVYATPDRPGNPKFDFNLRLVCAELCGLGHATMAIPVRLLKPAEFDKWLAFLAEQSKEPTATCKPEGTALEISALEIAFDKRCLAAPAGKPFTINFDNLEAVPHNVSIARDKEFKDIIFRGEVFAGPGSRVYRVGALPAGAYFFHCDVHPIPAMSGVVNVTKE